MMTILIREILRRNGGEKEFLAPPRSNLANLVFLGLSIIIVKYHPFYDFKL